MKLQDAVKKETVLMVISCAVCCIIAIVAFALLHIFFPESVPFDYKVVLGLLFGSAVAAGNFFWMAVSVQKVSAAEEDDRAKALMRTSYRYRTLMQLAWVILAIFLPFVNIVAGIIPLFFPGIVIKLRGIISAGRGGVKTGT